MEPRRSSTKFSYADLELLEEDGLRHEIIDGAHFVTASPVTRHQRISARLFMALQSFLAAHPLGEALYAPFDVVMSVHDVVVPDLIYVSQSRAQRITAKNLQGAPDLAIEILSPSTRRLDERLKLDLYERAGVDEYWLVDPDRNLLTIHRRHGTHFLPAVTFDANAVVTTPLFPGFELNLGDILR